LPGLLDPAKKGLAPETDMDYSKNYD